LGAMSLLMLRQIVLTVLYESMPNQKIHVGQRQSSRVIVAWQLLVARLFHSYAIILIFLLDV